MDIFSVFNEQKRNFKLNLPYAKLSLSTDGGLFINDQKVEPPFTFTIIFHGMQFFRFNAVKEKTDILSTIAPVTNYYNRAIDIYSKKTYEELNATISLSEGKITWKTVLGIVYNNNLYVLELTRSSSKAFIEAMQKANLRSTIVIDPEPGFTQFTLTDFTPQKKGAIKYLMPNFRFDKIITKSAPEFNALYDLANKMLQEVEKFNKFDNDEPEAIPNDDTIDF